MKRKEFNVRTEELPVFGEFVESSYLHDKELFAAFSPLYANGFAENFHNKLLAVQEAALPHILTGQMKIATENQYMAQESMLKLLGHIERYWQMAADSLPLKIDDLKLSELRKNLRKHDAESVLQGAKFLQQSMQPYMTVLQEKGLTTDKVEELARLIEDIKKGNLEQNNLLNERRRKVEENLTLLNDFWSMVYDILKTGKLIHQDNPVRKAEYTEKKITSRVHVVFKAKQVQETKEPVPEEQLVESD
jgi:hypothetical protein